MRRILRLDQTFLFNLSIIHLKSNYVPKILDFCPFPPYFWVRILFRTIKNAWKRFYITNLFQASQYQSSIQFYDRHPLLFLVLSKFKINFISIFTTWQAVHLYTQNAFLLVGSISQTLRINQKSDWATPGILYLVINDYLALYFPVHENLLFH